MGEKFSRDRHIFLFITRQGLRDATLMCSGCQRSYITNLPPDMIHQSGAFSYRLQPLTASSALETTRRG